MPVPAFSSQVEQILIRAEEGYSVLTEVLYGLYLCNYVILHRRRFFNYTVFLVYFSLLHKFILNYPLTLSTFCQYRTLLTKALYFIDISLYIFTCLFVYQSYLKLLIMEHH